MSSLIPVTLPSTPLKLCLVSDDDAVKAALQIRCPRPHEVVYYAAEGLVTEQNTLSAHGEQIVQTRADAVLVEWAMEKAPVLNTLCYHLRRVLRAPVIMLCRGSLADQVAALAAGADDVMVSPFYLPLVQAKVLAYRRLMQAARDAVQTNDVQRTATRDVHRFGVLHLDRTAHRFFIRDTEVALTPREFALLNFLIEHADTLCTRDQILDRVWGLNFDTGTNMVDVYMYFLRRKLEAHGLAGIIQTVRGHGYRLVLPEAARDDP